MGAIANIDALRRWLHEPCLAEVLRLSKSLAILALGFIDGLHSTASGGFFAWVTGGPLPAALGANWPTAAWDQNAYNFITGPARAVVEECESQKACRH